MMEKSIVAVPAKYKKKYLVDQITACMNRYTADVKRLLTPDKLQPRDFPAGVVIPEVKFRTETELSAWRYVKNLNKTTRIRSYGHPIWYAEVLFTGPSKMTKSTSDGRWLGGIHEFSVTFLLSFVPGVSTELFEDMTDDITVNRKGLLLYLRDLGYRHYEFPDPDVNGRIARGYLSIGVYEDSNNMDKDLRVVTRFRGNDQDRVHQLTFVALVQDVT